ncbi:hypothetical protein RsTz2092_07430 [Deferribacterales bacterium RsTz2092]|nr:hypothetical protein AGMMS49941_07380 [Deferribacterales bacterium]
MSKNVCETFGLIEHTTAHSIYVRTEVSSACNGCRADAVCSSNSERIFKITPPNADTFSTGERVRIIISDNAGLTMVFGVYFLSAILAIFVAVVAHFITHSDVVSAVSFLISAMLFLVLSSYRLKGYAGSNICVEHLP